jgi:hypothetical protein
VRVLPDDAAALAEADAHRGEPEAHLRVLLELASELGLTVVGFLRGNSMVVYSADQRILSEPAAILEEAEAR